MHTSVLLCHVLYIMHDGDQHQPLTDEQAELEHLPHLKLCFAPIIEVKEMLQDADRARKTRDWLIIVNRIVMDG